jgi:threonine/homoserine/homoserine lactone efflux protein
MLPYLILGATFAFAAAVQPGPLLTYLIAQTLQNGWRRTLPATLAPVMSDGPIIVLVLFVLTRLPSSLEPALRCAGGVFLLYLAWNASLAWWRYQAPQGGPLPSVRHALLRATVVNLLNPNPYLGWSLVMGPLLLKGWRETPAHGLALLAGFYLALVVTTAGVLALFAGARRLGARVTRDLIGASAVALALFAVYQLSTGMTLLLTR